MGQRRVKAELILPETEEGRRELERRLAVIREEVSAWLAEREETVKEGETAETN